MAEGYKTDDEQAEAIKKWLRENGSALLTGILLGLAALFGGKAWMQYQTQQSMAASNLYAQLSNAVSGGQAAAATSAHEALLNEYADSSYAVLAALQIARLQLDEDKPEAAQVQLQWAYERAGDGPLKHTARVRLARLYIAQGELDRARALLGEVTDRGSYAVIYHELEGDLAMAREDYAAARAAYQAALAAYPDDLPGRSLLEAKRDDAARVGGEGAA
ncbi:MAG TPA: tetratricopeptide repeat protein [Thiohalobacter sp.]|nr:tetratricopeptide repeat protein [Thiohalobacter sp.]